MKKLGNCCFILTILLLFNCSGIGTSKHVSKTDFGKLLVFSLDYVLNNNKLAVDYYNQPLQIVKSKEFPVEGHLVVNGKECVLLPESTKVMDILQKMDIFKPVPLVEIHEFKSINNTIMLRLIFRATGGGFNLNITQDEDGKYTVSKMESFEV